jgi:histidine phosphotransfer protein HptB
VADIAAAGVLCAMHEGDSEDLINWATYTETRNLLGADFVRILGYFREDGMKSVSAIEDAMRNRDSAGMVMPAHTLKGEAYQLGAEKLAILAETIEFNARHYVELRQDPGDIIDKAAHLRPVFEATLDALETEISPLVERRAPGGSRTMGISAFGRL